jgi:outer membrane protein OmpA-like peptidoglycan-associated protein
MKWEEALKEYRLNNDTVMYIPFLQRNKLFGRVNLNRTKLSALGEIPINNIKISVEGNEKTYSTLTDEEGYFEIFIPVADYYKVKVNNIFYEHFDLRQEYYIVKFNGYKNFEVSFDFDEKERKIEFDPEDFLIDEDDVADDDFTFDDIRIIKQTNLKGTVRDANSLLPIHSTVSVYNGSNELISETASSNRTGVYFTSFFAGDNYSIEVSSKGYWVYKSTLNIQQVTTFENLTEDVLLSKINIDEKIKADNLKFQKDKTDLTPLARAELDNIIQLLNLNSSVVVEVSGHTDNIEALLTNPQELSLARATSVSSYLVKNGIEERRIKVVAKGSTDPENLEDSEQGRAKNRRVDIKVAGF